MSLWSHPLSLTAPAPGPHLSAGQRSREGIQEGQLAQQEQQVPRTPRSTAVPAVPTPAVAVRSDQFTAAMQGLHDLGTTVATGGGEAAVARAEQHRRMSQMSTNYTDVSALHCIHITILFIYPTHSIYRSLCLSLLYADGAQYPGLRVRAQSVVHRRGDRTRDRGDRGSDPGPHCRQGPPQPAPSWETRCSWPGH